mgnify:CR=1 FL=1
MCGIVGYVGKRNAQNVLLDGLEKLEYRGYDSAGVALALEGGIRVVKSKGRLAELRKKLELQALAESRCGIGHTRWATHGEPSDVNSHPHSTPRVSIVHNGIIENYGILKERLMAKGYTFESETDTEVLVKLIDNCYEGEPLKALHEALGMVRGSYALAVLFKDFPDTVFAVKRESPLIVGWGEGENFVASDIPALLKYTRKYSVLEEGDLAVVTAGSIQFYNEFAEPVEREVLTADWDMEAAEKGGYPHFMLKEINEQPAAITATVSPRVENGLPDLRIPELSDEVLRGIGTIHLVACGTAMHAGMVGKAAIEALARVPAEVDIASEFRYRNPILRPNDLVIIISQSGETSDTLAALKKSIKADLAKKRQEAVDRDFENEAVVLAGKNMTCDIPACMIDEQVDKHLEQFAYQLQSQGMKMEDYVKMIGGDVKGMRDSMRPMAEQTVRSNILLSEIVHQENIDVTDEEVEEELKKLAEQYKMELDKIREMIDVEAVKSDLKGRKAVKLIVDNAKPVEKEKEKKAAKKAAKKEDEAAEAPAEEAPKAEE